MHARLSFLTSLWHFTALTRCPDLVDHYTLIKIQQIVQHLQRQNAPGQGYIYSPEHKTLVA